MKSEKKNKIVSTMMVFIVFLVLVASVATYIYFGTHPYAEEKYDLCEIEEGLYAKYYKVISRAPAYNTEVVSFCSNGQVLTFEGQVTILYSDEVPQATIQFYRLNGMDKIVLRVPKNSVDFLPNISIY